MFIVWWAIALLYPQCHAGDRVDLLAADPEVCDVEDRLLVAAEELHRLDAAPSTGSVEAEWLTKKFY
tara:strand:+ start:261 stop:461 length:201 start_codon:yes stop_codon:yes gene_type:complete